MTSLCRQLSAQEIVNWVTTADGCVHTVFTADATRLDSFVSSASAVCIGLNRMSLIPQILFVVPPRGENTPGYQLTIGVGDGGRGGTCPQNLGKYVSGNYCVKFGHFRAKNHVKLVNFVIFL